MTLDNRSFIKILKCPLIWRGKRRGVEGMGWEGEEMGWKGKGGRVG